MNALLADALVMMHLLFVAFVVGGGFLLVRWPRLGWWQLPAAAWGAYIEFTGGICPLTPLENYLRVRGGGGSYSGGFVERYLVPVLYPSGLADPDGAGGCCRGCQSGSVCHGLSGMATQDGRVVEGLPSRKRGIDPACGQPAHSGGRSST